MKVYQRVALVLGLLGVGWMHASAGEWGGTVGVNSSYSAEDDEFVLGTTASGFVQGIAVGAYQLEVRGNASLRYELPEEETSVTAQISHLILSKDPWEIGRMAVSDSSGLVLSQSLDGARWSRSGDRGTVRAGLFTPGLLRASNSRVRLTSLDATRSAETDEYLLAAPRIIAGLGFAGEGNWDAHLWVSADSRKLFAYDGETVGRAGDREEDNPGAGGVYSGVHPSVTLRYPLPWGARIESALAGAFGIGSRPPFIDADEGQWQQDITTAVAGRIALFQGVGLWLITAEIDGAMGDASNVGDVNTEGLNTQYRSLTPVVRGSVIGLEIPNTYSFRLSGAVSPFSGERLYSARNIRFTLSGGAFFRVTAGSISFSDVDEESLSPYLGSEIGAGMAWQFSPDTSVSLQGNAFIPGGAVLNSYAEGKPVVTTAQLSVTVTM